jgi:DNA-binding transcriptional LysR family regulator
MARYRQGDTPVTSLDRIDWNLVPALDALLTERNVSRAARRLGISQSAASGALARLRRHYGDDLLVRRNNTYELTPVALRLLSSARAAVDSTRIVLASTSTFDPGASTREFQVLSTEYGQTLLGGDLLARVGAAAPGVRVTFRWPSSLAGSPADWLSTYDGWLGPRESIPTMSSSGLTTDRWVCVVDEDHPTVGDELSIAEVAEHRWVVPTRPRDHDLPWRQRLFAHGIELPIACSTESFSAVPFLVAGTPLVGIVQHTLALRLVERCRLRVLEVPWSMLPLSLTLWWHPNREHDLAHAWFRDQVAATMASVAGGVGNADG